MMYLVLAYYLLFAVPAQSTSLSEKLDADSNCAADDSNCNDAANWLQHSVQARDLLASSEGDHVEGTLWTKAQNCGIAQVKPTEMNSSNPPVVVGTPANGAAAPVDLTGVWWLKWGTSQPHWMQWAVTFYEFLRYEILYTFADATHNSTEFPLTVTFPGAKAHHWGYSDSLSSRVGQFLVSWGFSTGQWREPGQTIAEEVFQINFENSTYGTFNLSQMPDVYTFQKLDDDTWSRPSYLSSGLVVTYNCTRIIDKDGKPTKHYNDYVESMSGWLGHYKLRVWDSDDQCMRRCQATFSVLTWWLNGCTVCKMLCKL